MVDWEAAGLMIFRLAYEKCGLNPAKPDFFSAGCGLANLQLASGHSGKNRSILFGGAPVRGNPLS